MSSHELDQPSQSDQNSVLSSSDAGEREERDATSVDYWQPHLASPKHRPGSEKAFISLETRGAEAGGIEEQVCLSGKLSGSEKLTSIAASQSESELRQDLAKDSEDATLSSCQQTDVEFGALIQPSASRLDATVLESRQADGREDELEGRERAGFGQQGHLMDSEIEEPARTAMEEDLEAYENAMQVDPPASTSVNLLPSPNASSPLSTIPSSSPDPMAMSPVAARRVSSSPSHSPPPLRTTRPASPTPIVHSKAIENNGILETSQSGSLTPPMAQHQAYESPSPHQSPQPAAASPTPLPSLANGKYSPSSNAHSTHSTSPLPQVSALSRPEISEWPPHRRQPTSASPTPFPSLPYGQPSPAAPSESHPSQLSELQQSQPASPPQNRPATQRSPSAQNSPSPSPPPIIPPSPPLRSFRSRTKAQLNPFTVEQSLYTRSLLKNGWQGAVVAGVPRGRDLSSAELQRKKEEAESRPKDSLGGWLEFEEGKGQIVDDFGGSGGRGEEESSDGSVDGETLLEREARKKERMERDIVRAFGERKRRREVDSRESDDGSARHKKSQVGQDATRRQRASSATESRTKTTSNPTASKSRVPSSTNHSRAPQLRQNRSNSQPQDSDDSFTSSRRPRASSEPLSSPRHPSRPQHREKKKKKGVGGVSRKRAIGGAAVLGAIHRQRKAGHSEDELEDDLRGMGRMAGGRTQIDLTLEEEDMDDEMEASDDEDEEESASDTSVERPRPRSPTPPMRLDGKRGKALRSMMPGIFFKKALKDIELMDEEKARGDFTVYDRGSGDEDSEGESEARKGKGRIRYSPGRGDNKFVGEAFTDESGDEERSEEEEDAGPDAVGNWLETFAPRRAGKDQDDGYDRIDRVLGRTMATHSKDKKSSSTTRRRDSGGVDTSKPSDGKRLQESNGRRKQTKGSAKRSSRRSKSQPIRSLALDTDDALFDYPAQSALDLQSDPSDEIENHNPSTRDILPSIERQLNSDRRWASYAKFSPDFEIPRLPTGIYLSPTSFVRKGRLHSLLVAPMDSPPPRRCRPFNLTLDSAMTSEELDAMLPQLCDALFDVSAAILAEEEAAGGYEATGESMRFLGGFTTEVARLWPKDVATRFAIALWAQIDRLDSRLDALALTSTSVPRSFHRIRITLSWYQLDLAVRVLNASFVDDFGTSIARFDSLARNLVRKLVEYQVSHTVKSLKEAAKRQPSPPEEGNADDQEFVPRIVDDPTVEVWVGIISLALRPADVAEDGWTFGEKEFWELVLEEVDRAVPKSGPVPGEVAAYTAMMLCALSQFSPSGGHTQSQPRLHTFWPVVFRALDPLKPDIIADESSLSNTSLARRDRYLQTIFVRCLIFVDKWGWRIEMRNSDLLSKLFGIVNARHLADLSIEPSADYPIFISDLSKFDSATAFDSKTDTMFTSFLKLVIRAASTVDTAQSKVLTRMLMRVSPLTVGGWTRESPEVARGESALVNHFSLLITLAALAPASAASRLDHARRLVSFANVDKRARIACIRAMLYFATVYHKNGLSLAPVLEWLATSATTLRTEFVDLVKKSGEATRKKGSADPIKDRSFLLALVLRSVQKTLTWKRDSVAQATYPDLGLLNAAWTTDLINSSVALDPTVGREVIDCIDCFFEVRRAALPRYQAGENGVSQDEFGQFDMDYDDPELNKALGVDVDAFPEARTDLQTQDRAFAKLVNTTVSPALFGLLNSIFAWDGPATLSDRSAYAALLVECWAKGISVLVEHGLSEWRRYLRFGDHSWRRISDPIGRRDVGLLLSIQILKHEPTVYNNDEEEFLDIWMQSISARKLSVQHKLTSSLLNLDNPSALFVGLPFQRSEDSAQFDISEATFESHRVEVFQTFLRNATKVLGQGLYSQARDALAKPAVTNLLRSGFSAMRDNLSMTSLPSNTTAPSNISSEVSSRSTSSASGSSAVVTGSPQSAEDRRLRGLLRGALAHTGTAFGYVGRIIGGFGSVFTWVGAAITPAPMDVDFEDDNAPRTDAVNGRNYVGDTADDSDEDSDQAEMDSIRAAAPIPSPAISSDIADFAVDASPEVDATSPSASSPKMRSVARRVSFSLDSTPIASAGPRTRNQLFSTATPPTVEARSQIRHRSPSPLQMVYDIDPAASTPHRQQAIKHSPSVSPPALRATRRRSQAPTSFPSPICHPNLTPHASSSYLQSLGDSLSADQKREKLSERYAKQILAAARHEAQGRVAAPELGSTETWAPVASGSGSRKRGFSEAKEEILQDEKLELVEARRREGAPMPPEEREKKRSKSEAVEPQPIEPEVHAGASQKAKPKKARPSRAKKAGRGRGRPPGSSFDDNEKPYYPKEHKIDRSHLLRRGLPALRSRGSI
ncbi:hypothetical protein P7C70_g1116, partial [Phenoliferia sp. Uapishka_3]